MPHTVSKKKLIFSFNYNISFLLAGSGVQPSKSHIISPSLRIQTNSHFPWEGFFLLILKSFFKSISTLSLFISFQNQSPFDIYFQNKTFSKRLNLYLIFFIKDWKKRFYMKSSIVVVPKLIKKHRLQYNSELSWYLATPSLSAC